MLIYDYNENGITIDDLHPISKELQQTQTFTDNPTRQLRKIISKSIGNATLQMLTLWLDMFKSEKENDIEWKRNEAIPETHAQPIT